MPADGQGRDHSPAVASTPLPGLGERIVVVSPHLDDGVLSLGAAMHAWASAGARVELLTPLGCDPCSDAPAGGWDARGGFATEGEAARRRREEDAEACALLGVTPAWLRFGSVDYERHGEDEEVAEAVGEAVSGADRVLLPGFPLTHPDHAWLVRLLLARAPMLGRRLSLYAEQPYASRSDATPSIPGWAAASVGGPAPFLPLRRRPGHVLAKWRAIRRYRSQIPLLALDEVGRGTFVLAFAAERVADVRID